MPTLISSQNFDNGIIAPNLPGSWNFSDTNWRTTTSGTGVTPTSSPNMLEYTGSGSVTSFGTYGTIDNNSGNVTVVCNLANYSSGNPGWYGITARGSTSNITSSSTYYAAWVNANLGYVFIDRVNSGTTTNVTSIQNPSGIPSWCQMSFALTGGGSSTPGGGSTPLIRSQSQGSQIAPHGTVSLGTVTLSLSLYDPATKTWMNSNGLWTSTPAACILDFSDTSGISGAGYHGVYFGNSPSANTTYYDDWALYQYYDLPYVSTPAGPPSSPAIMLAHL